MRHTKKQYGRYGNLALVICLSVGVFFTATTKADAKELILRVEAKYQQDEFIDLRDLVEWKYSNSRKILKNRKLLSINVKGKSVNRYRNQAILELVIGSESQSSEYLNGFMERIQLKSSYSSYSSSWYLDVRKGPAYIKEIVLVLSDKNRGNGNSRCGFNCRSRSVCNSHTSSRELKRTCNRVVSKPSITRACYEFTRSSPSERLCLKKQIPPDYTRNCSRRSGLEHQYRCLEQFGQKEPIPISLFPPRR